uniref:DDE-1 domain-containing protein n=1 Tax=Peronospora matthiolae TaxID=2874970 RepID=A0AAV1VB08_9STRA
MKLFMTKKEAKRTWLEHFLYMLAVSDARGRANSLVLDNIVHHASPELMNVMRAKYGPTQSDFLHHARRWRISCSRSIMVVARWDAKSSQRTLTRDRRGEPALIVKRWGTCSETAALMTLRWTKSRVKAVRGAGRCSR